MALDSVKLAIDTTVTATQHWWWEWELSLLEEFNFLLKSLKTSPKANLYIPRSLLSVIPSNLSFSLILLDGSIMMVNTWNWIFFVCVVQIYYVAQAG